MQTSKKIIIAVAGNFIALLIAGLLMLRNDLQPLLMSKPKKKYQAVSAGKFTGLDFSSNWDVRIKQGREFKVEFAAEGGTILTPKVENIGGVLYFKTTAINGVDSAATLHAKVTMPELQTIKAVQGTKVFLEGFEMDTLKVVLEGGGAFAGKNNHYKHVSIKTSGNATMDLSQGM